MLTSPSGNTFGPVLLDCGEARFTAVGPAGHIKEPAQPITAQPENGTAEKHGVRREAKRHAALAGNRARCPLLEQQSSSSLAIPKMTPQTYYQRTGLQGPGWGERSTIRLT